MSDTSRSTITFTRTVNERYRDQLSANRSRAVRILVVYCAITFGMLAAAIATRPGLISVLLLWLGIGLMHLLAAQLVLDRWSLRDHRRDEKGSTPNPITVTLSTEGLWTASPYISTCVAWSSVTDIADLPSIIAFTRKGAAAVTVPKSAFASDEAAAAFLAEARKRREEGQALPPLSLGDMGAPGGVTVTPTSADLQMLTRWWIKNGGRRQLVRARIVFVPFWLACIVTSPYVFPDPATLVLGSFTSLPAVAFLIALFIREWRGDTLLRMLAGAPGAKSPFAVGLTERGVITVSKFAASVYHWPSVEQIDAAKDAVYMLFRGRYILRVPWRAFAEAGGGSETFLAYALARWQGSADQAAEPSAVWPPAVG